MKNPINALEYQHTPTYDGSGQCVHPSIVHFSNKWKGHRFWMVFTPYPKGNPLYENPSILVSNDGDAWKVPEGLSNPIDLIESSHFSDPDLFYDEESDSLWCYYCSLLNLEIFRIFRKTSSNGIKWCEAEKMLESIEDDLMSPTMVKIDSIYYLWTVNRFPNIIKRRSSSDGLEWSPPITCVIDRLPSGKEPWHLDVEYIEDINEYWMLLTVVNIGTSGKSSCLCFARSKDGLKWNVKDGYFLDVGKTWDNNLIYKASGIVLNDIYHIWYSACDGLRNWHIGRTFAIREMPICD